MRNPRYNAVGALLIFLMYCTCGDEIAPSKQRNSTYPDQQLEDFTFIESDFGSPLWELRASHMSEFKVRDMILVEDVHVDFYDSRNDSFFITSILRSDSGELRTSLGDIRVWGNVVVTTSDSARLLTGWLTWSKEAELVSTRDSVLILRNDTSVRGIGLESDPALENVRILNDVSGTLVQDE